MKKDFIMVLGPQGSGKSTQAKLLAESLKYKFISTGQLVRDLSDSLDPKRFEFEKYWKKGALIPDQMIEDLLFKKILNDDVCGFVLDGYPRNINQLKSFLNFLKQNEFLLSKVFYVHVSDNECLKRIKIRVTLENRADETEEAISKRLDIYHNETEPLLEEYRKLGILLQIDGERSIEEIQADIQKHFNS